MTRIRVNAAGEPGLLSMMLAKAMEEIRAFDDTKVPEGWIVSKFFVSGHRLDTDFSKMTVTIDPRWR